MASVLMTFDWMLNLRPTATQTIERLTLLALLFGIGGCGAEDDLHAHADGEHGGYIIALGQDHFHAESLFADGELQLFMLGKQEHEVINVESQTVEAFLRPFGDARSRTIRLQPRPQNGDAEGKTSRFVGKLPDDLPPTRLLVVVPSIKINETRYRFSYTTPEPLMPTKVTDERERELYLKPGGLYTLEDIKANGEQTASEKFANFRAAHDPNPKPGATICPITSTLANPECGWVINGQSYLFCCPPCIDEFLQRAKTEPDTIKPAESYRQQDSS